MRRVPARRGAEPDPRRGRRARRRAARPRRSRSGTSSASRTAPTTTSRSSRATSRRCGCRPSSSGSGSCRRSRRPRSSAPGVAATPGSRSGRPACSPGWRRRAATRPPDGRPRRARRRRAAARRGAAELRLAPPPRQRGAAPARRRQHPDRRRVAAVGLLRRHRRLHHPEPQPRRRRARAVGRRASSRRPPRSSSTTAGRSSRRSATRSCSPSPTRPPPWTIALELASRGADEDDPFPAVRAGIAHGAVVRRLGDVFGSTVNAASRLTSAARPGSVLVDAGVHEALARRGRRRGTVALPPRPPGLGQGVHPPRGLAREATVHGRTRRRAGRRANMKARSLLTGETTTTGQCTNLLRPEGRAQPLNPLCSSRGRMVDRDLPDRHLTVGESCTRGPLGCAQLPALQGLVQVRGERRGRLLEHLGARADREVPDRARAGRARGTCPTNRESSATES